MAEDIKKNVGSEEPENESPQGEEENKDTYSKDDYNKVVAESITRKKKLEKAEAELKKIQEEKLTESEKKDLHIKQLEEEIKGLKDKDKQKDIDVYISDSIAGKNFIDIPAVKLLVKAELSGEEEIDSKAVEKVVEDLIKNKPYLISSAAPNPSSGNFAKKDNEPAKNADQMMGDFLHGE
jgi:hypothetical protein